MHSDRVLLKSAYMLAPLFFMGAMRKLTTLHRRHHFDIFHAHWVIPNAPMAALVSRASGVPLVISLHGSDIFVAQKHRLLGAVARACFRQAQAVTACSPQLHAGALVLGADPTRTHLLLWGADPEVFDPDKAPSCSEMRSLLGLPEASLVVLSLGRLVKKKGVEYLVRAMPLLRSRVPHAQVVIAGDGPERPSLERMAETLKVSDMVQFVGQIPWYEVAKYLHASDVFVVPSIEDESGNLDGLPTSILEAMAAAKPVVASAVAGIPLVVEHEQTGLLVPQRNPQALADALQKLLQDEDFRKRLGAEGRRRVLSQYNWDTVAQTFTRLYKQAQSFSDAHI